MITVRLMARAHRPGFSYVDTQLYELCVDDTNEEDLARIGDTFEFAGITFAFDRRASDGSEVYVIGKQSPLVIEILKDRKGHPKSTIIFAREGNGGVRLLDGTFLRDGLPFRRLT